MRRNLILNVLAISLLFGTAASADPIIWGYPYLYQNIGTENPISYSFSATATGDVTAYFFGSSAAYDDKIGMIDSSTDASNDVNVDNNTSISVVYSEQFDFGYVTQGDILTFYMIVNNGSTVSTVYSNPDMNASYDGTPTGTNHVYATTFVPFTTYEVSGVYIGFEDTARLNLH